VVLGGTVLFVLTNGHPTIAITLATAESGKIAAMSNYIQPQMLDTDALFRRKIYGLRDKYTFRSGAHPAAAVRVHIDAQGKVVSKTIVSESPENSGRGRVLLDVMEEEKFIPAQSNGQAVAGDFELAVDFEHMINPDEGARTGTLIPNDGL
jgi:TonB family protein